MSRKNLRLATRPALVLGLFMLPLNSARAGDLKWSFKEGESLRYEMVQTTRTEVKAPAQTIRITQTQTTETTWKVESVAEDGSAQIAQKFDRFRVKIESSSGVVEYDTASEKAPEGLLAATMVPTYKALAGSTFRYTMTPRGEVRDIVVPKGLLESLGAGKSGPSGASAFSEEGLRNMIVETTLVLPAEPVAEGDTWTRQSKAAGPIGTEVRDKLYRHAGLDEKTKAERVTLNVKTSLEASSQPGLEVKLENQDDFGSYLFDSVGGRVISAERDQNMKVVYVVNGPSQPKQEVVETRHVTSAMKLKPAGGKGPVAN